MIKKPVSELKLVRSRDPIPTIEVDVSCIDDPCDGRWFGDFVFQALQPIAAASPEMLASLYVYCGPSVNFHTLSYSVFIGVAGNTKLLKPLLSVFQMEDRVDARLCKRLCGYTPPSKGRCEFHIQDGHVWHLNTLFKRLPHYKPHLYLLIRTVSNNPSLGSSNNHKEKILKEKPVSELKFVRSREPIPTIEVDVSCIDDDPCDCRWFGDYVFQALQPIAAASPEMLASLYVYCGPSVNFHTPFYSVFIGVAGNEKLLEPLLSVFQMEDGIDARLCDHIPPTKGRCEFHIQEGHVWLLNTLFKKPIWYTE